MPITDSISVTVDSAQLFADSIFRSDSLARIDSIARADSIAYADSVLQHRMSGFEGLLPVGVPSDQSWVFGLLLFAFALLVFSVVRSIVPPLQLLADIFSVKERNSIFSKTSIDSLEQKVYFLVFTIIIFALQGYLIFYDYNQAFDWQQYLTFVLIVIGFYVIKFILAKILAFVFFDKGIFKQLIDSYISIGMLTSVLYFASILVFLYSDLHRSPIAGTVGLIILCVGITLFTIRLIQFFLHKVVVSLYLILYLCTLEILPVIVLLQIFQLLA
jgi:hypothetical protein